MSPGIVVSSTDEGGWLGVEIAEVTAEKAKDLKLSAVRGVIVDGVEPDSPAAKAGIKEKDVITQYDGQPVEGAVQFRRLIRETPPGRSITLEISRGGSLQNISVELGDRTDVYVRKMKGKMRDFGGAYSFSMPNVEELPDMPEVMDSRTPVLGINAEDLTSQLGSYFGAPNNAGVLVREVRPGTPADKAGLKAGDVIIKVEGKEVRTLADLRAQLREKSDQASVKHVSPAQRIGNRGHSPNRKAAPDGANAFRPSRPTLSPTLSVDFVGGPGIFRASPSSSVLSPRRSLGHAIDVLPYVSASVACCNLNQVR